MGLGLQLFARLPAASVFARIESQARTFARASGEPLASWFRASSTSEGAAVSLFPCEEDVLFSAEDDLIVCSAKTSSAGPGYHAHVVRLLDQLQRALGLQWTQNPLGREDEGGDETGYFEARDFEALRHEMLQWLRSLSRMLISSYADESSCVMLAFPVNAPRPVSDAYGCSVMGEWPRSFFQQLCEADDSELARLGATFFPWWDEGVTRENLHAFALARAWMDVRWVAGSDDDDALNRSVLRAFEQGTPRTGTPPAADEIAELRRLVNDPDSDRVPAPAGIGYHRRPMIFSLPGQWSITAPGYFSYEQEEDGTTVLYFSERTIRITSLRAKTPRSPAEHLKRMSNGPTNFKPLTLPAHLAGHAAVSYSEHERCQLLEAEIAKTDGLCIVSIYYADRAQAAWARATAESISCPVQS